MIAVFSFVLCTQEADAIKKLADALREKKGVPWAVAKMEMASGETDYVEYFRGKDFARYFRTNPEKLSAVIPQKAGKCVVQAGRHAIIVDLSSWQALFATAVSTGRVPVKGCPFRAVSYQSFACCNQAWPSAIRLVCKVIIHWAGALDHPCLRAFCSHPSAFLTKRC